MTQWRPIESRQTEFFNMKASLDKDHERADDKLAALGPESERHSHRICFAVWQAADRAGIIRPGQTKRHRAMQPN
jgi:hypothetical protein